MKIAVIIYEGVELVDMNGPLDVFLHVNGIIKGRYDIYTVAESKEPVKSEGGVVTLLPAHDFSDSPEPDVLIVPGLLDKELLGTTASAACVSYIKELMEKDKVILSVCVGLFNLAATGLLEGRRVTTHYLAIKEFQEEHPGIKVIKNVRFVSDGKLVSTGGITSGIDGALHLVETFDGESVARQVADLMVYNRKAPLPEDTVIPD